jgi:ABC-type microcin C transport system duplicated ATPase subunit YejF
MSLMLICHDLPLVTFLLNFICEVSHGRRSRSDIFTSTTGVFRNAQLHSSQRDRISSQRHQLLVLLLKLGLLVLCGLLAFSLVADIG